MLDMSTVVPINKAKAIAPMVSQLVSPAGAFSLSGPLKRAFHTSGAIKP
jgi:hypothetical protein